MYIIEYLNLSMKLLFLEVEWLEAMQYIKHTKIGLCSSTQGVEESLHRGSAHQNLKSVIIDCNFRTETADENRKAYGIDAFITGKNTTHIRQKCIKQTPLKE